jgi:Tfp pilus assembly ATPase PilU
LSSALATLINKPERKIWTAEDPVEITPKGLRQVHQQKKPGQIFYHERLRADPDVIMVGEMRDKETVSTGIEAHRQAIWYLPRHQQRANHRAFADMAWTLLILLMRCSAFWRNA